MIRTEIEIGHVDQLTLPGDPSAQVGGFHGTELCLFVLQFAVHAGKLHEVVLLRPFPGEDFEDIGGLLDIALLVVQHPHQQVPVFLRLLAAPPGFGHPGFNVAQRLVIGLQLVIGLGQQYMCIGRGIRRHLEPGFQHARRALPVLYHEIELREAVTCADLHCLGQFRLREHLLVGPDRVLVFFLGVIDERVEIVDIREFVAVQRPLAAVFALQGFERALGRGKIVGLRGLLRECQLFIDLVAQRRSPARLLGSRFLFLGMDHAAVDTR